MFLGHIAVGLAGKRFAPRASLATLLFAPMFLDYLWPIFLLLGWEKVRVDPGNTVVTPLAFDSYPWSHSLHMTLFWAGLVAIVFRTVTRDTRSAIWIGIAVASHWVMDWITHRPDLPLWPSGPKVGLGLWLYMRDTRPRGGRGRLSLWSFVVAVTLIYFMNLASNLGPIPTSVSPRTIAMMGLALWIFIPWAWWIDYTRRTVR